MPKPEMTTTETAFAKAQQLDIINGYINEQRWNMKIPCSGFIDCPPDLMRRYNLDPNSVAADVIANINKLIQLTEQKPIT